MTPPPAPPLPETVAAVYETIDQLFRGLEIFCANVQLQLLLADRPDDEVARRNIAEACRFARTLRQTFRDEAANHVRAAEQAHHIPRIH